MGLLAWLCVFSFLGGMLSFVYEATNQRLTQ